MKNYSVLAKYYDRFSQNDCDYDGWSQYLFKLASEHNVKTVADIACGTGKMTELLVKRGFNVVGIDESEEMLTQAMQKCHGKGVKFARQNMKKLSLPSKADMAVAVNDAVNYLKPSELEVFFGAVWQNLKPNAPFVFDISSAHKLENILANNVFYFDDEDATLLWTNKTTAEKTCMSVTVFEKCGEEYFRFDEQHTQFIHQTETICSLLEKCRFTVCEVSDSYGKKLSSDSLRITFFALKKAENE